MPRSRRTEPFGAEYDRWLAKARIQGNDRLVEHMERIRPHLNLASNDGGEIHANAAHQFGRDMMELAATLQADPFDCILMMAGACAHVMHAMQGFGLHYQSINTALVHHLNDLAKAIRKHEAMTAAKESEHRG